MKRTLPHSYRTIYEKRRQAIQARLNDFENISKDQYFYELAFCILTPQSSAKNAEQAIEKLIASDFKSNPFDPTAMLREAKHYIRFHNTKAKRLLEALQNFSVIEPALHDAAMPAPDKREIVLAAINGLGMKESSHFLRNIGVKGLAILDRHILKHLSALKIVEEIPKNAPTKKNYLEIEERWKQFAKKVNISIDELDLLFWSMETGVIRK